MGVIPDIENALFFVPDYFGRISRLPDIFGRFFGGYFWPNCLTDFLGQFLGPIF